MPAIGDLELQVMRRIWRSHEPDIAIVDYDAPAIYCLPFGRRQIVVSAGALAALPPAVIACLPPLLAACSVTSHPWPAS